MVNISKNHWVVHWVVWIAIFKVNRERNVIKYTKILFLATLLFFFIQKIKAQQLPQFSQYTFNAFLLNPAVAGAEGYTAINLTNRAQWVGVEGATHTGILRLIEIQKLSITIIAYKKTATGNSYCRYI